MIYQSDSDSLLTWKAKEKFLQAVSIFQTQTSCKAINARKLADTHLLDCASTFKHCKQQKLISIQWKIKLSDCIHKKIRSRSML
jgi:hypothetical protein